MRKTQGIAAESTVDLQISWEYFQEFGSLHFLDLALQEIFKFACHERKCSKQDLLSVQNCDEGRAIEQEDGTVVPCCGLRNCSGRR